MWACETHSGVTQSSAKEPEQLGILIPYGAQFPLPHSHPMGEKPLNKRCAYPADPRQSAWEKIRFVHSRAYLDAFLRMLCACLCAIHKPAQHVSVSTMKTPMTVAVLACSLNCTVFSARHEDASVWMPVKVVHRLRTRNHQFKRPQFRGRTSGGGHGTRSEATDRIPYLCVIIQSPEDWFGRWTAASQPLR